MPVMQASTQVYTFSLDEMKKLVAADLGVPVDAVTVEYQIQNISHDPYDRYGTDKVTKVNVTVDMKRVMTPRGNTQIDR